MTEPAGGNRYCCGDGDVDTRHAKDPTAARIMRDLDGTSGFVVCRCAKRWGCKDPETVPRGTWSARSRDPTRDNRIARQLLLDRA